MVDFLRINLFFRWTFVCHTPRGKWIFPNRHFDTMNGAIADFSEIQSLHEFELVMYPIICAGFYRSQVVCRIFETINQYHLNSEIVHFVRPGHIRLEVFLF